MQRLAAEATGAGMIAKLLQRINQGANQDKSRATDLAVTCAAAAAWPIS
jgi:hypothetical protein